jgi:phosphoribosylanthranilate isomerase
MGEIIVKFCGLKHQNEVEACTKLGVNYIGFVFHKPSLRFISLEQFALLNFENAPQVVAVFQNPTVKEISQVLAQNRVDYIQLHGKNTDEIIEKFYGKVGIIQAISENDFTNHDLQNNNCDFLLFDGSQAGSGVERDFSFVSNVQSKVPFFLAGGININNFKNAIKYTNYIDLSSGIEEMRGVKSIQMMRDFMQEVRSFT